MSQLYRTSSCLFQLRMSTHMWVKLNVHPYNGVIEWLDSLDNSPPERFVQLVSGAISQWYTTITRSFKPPSNIRPIKVPIQPNDIECGFYVMRYMRDIIFNLRRDRQELFAGKKTYIREDIDIYRREWCTFIINRISRT